MRLNPYQTNLFVQHRLKEQARAKTGADSSRRALKWCATCGGKHRGICNLVITSAGTRCRVEILEQVEQRIRASRAKERIR